MQKPNIRILTGGAMLFLLAATLSTQAQVGYISVRVKALNEESSPAFPFTITGGPTTVAPFSLDDQPSTRRCSDLGGSHGAGAQLWVITGNGGNGLLMYRAQGQSGWTSTGDSATAVDGAGVGQCVYTTAKGYVVALDRSRLDTLYNPAHHHGHKAIDIANNQSLTAGQGETVIVDDQGHLVVYTGDYVHDDWSDASAINGAIPAGLMHVDVNVTNGDVLFSYSGNKIAVVHPNRSVTRLGLVSLAVPVNTDVAYDDLGTIYCIASTSASGGDGVCRWNGQKWLGDSTSRNIEHITGGVQDGLWGINGMASDGDCKASIFTRSTDSTHFWYDNEWVNPGQSNAILIPVQPGTYTITGSAVPNWVCQSVTLRDSLPQSSTSVAAYSATVTVEAGKIVGADFQNGLVQPVAIPQVCAYSIQQDFGTGPATYGAPLTGMTSYHYLAVGFPLDGYYSVTKRTGPGWGNPNLVDHTNGKGYFMLVNASYGKDEFFRERVTGLVPGLHYTLSAYIANISPQATLKPNVLFGISDAKTGIQLGATSTGDITNPNWQQYSFTFVATTTTADIYLANNGVGGAGNDLALDDIAFSPIPDPVSRIQVPGSDTICQGAAIQLSDTAKGGTWSSLDPSLASVSSAGLVTAAAGGAARVRFFTVNSIGCQAADTATLSIKPLASVHEVARRPAAVCTGSSTLLTASSATVTSPRFSWYADSGLTRLVDTGASLHTPVLRASTTYYVSVLGANVCAAPSTGAARDTVTVVAYPTVSSPVGPATLCAGASVTLSDATPGGFWSSSDSSLSVDSLGHVSGVTAGSGVVSYSVLNAGICRTTVGHTIAVWPMPSVAGIDGVRNLCQEDSVRVSDVTPGGVWSSSNAQVASIAEGLVLAGAVGTTSVVYTVTDTHGCSASASASMAVEGQPSTPLLDGGSAPNVCGGRTAPLTASSNGATVYKWYLDGVALTGDGGPVYNASMVGRYNVQGISDAGCVSPMGGPLEVFGRCEVNPQADVSLRKTVSAGPYSVQQPVTYTITVTNNGPGVADGLVVTDSLSPNLGEPAGYSGAYGGHTLSWSIATLAPGDSIELTFTIGIEALDNIANTATVTTTSPDPVMANNSATAILYTDAGLFIPNAVSPNGDGKNDRFLIVGLDRYPGSSLTVFNRWGNEVYHSDNYANDWSGANLNDGTYFYILLLNTSHGKEARKGWVEILHK